MINKLNIYWKYFLHWLDSSKWEKPKKPDFPFHYGQKLKVINGFYKGCTAIILKLDYDTGKYYFNLYKDGNELPNGPYNVGQSGLYQFEPMEKEE